MENESVGRQSRQGECAVECVAETQRAAGVLASFVLLPAADVVLGRDLENEGEVSPDLVAGCAIRSRMQPP